MAKLNSDWQNRKSHRQKIALLKRCLWNVYRTNACTILLLLSLTIISFLIWNQIPQFKDDAKHYLSKGEFYRRAKLLLNRPEFRGKYCWQNDCFIVEDVWQESEHRSGFSTFKGPIRIIKPANFKGVVLVETALKLPTEYTYENLNSSKWHVDKLWVSPVGYLSTMISGIFTLGALRLDRNVVGDVLFIGLGAGGLSNFVSIAFPNINVTMVDINPSTRPMALEQFDVIENEKSRIIIEDGAKFIRDQVAQGNVNSFDAIVVDACYNNDKKLNVCPIDEFIDEGALRAFKSLLRKSGVIIYNVLTMDLAFEKRKTLNDVIFAKNVKIFGRKGCKMIPVDALINQVIFCSPSILPKEKDQQIVKKNFDEMFKRKENEMIDLEMAMEESVAK